MKISKVRKCYASGWCVECQVDEHVWDVECASEPQAKKLYHFLKMLQHKRKAWL